MLGLALLLFLVLLYFLPSILTIGRHRNAAAVFALNLFLGWTLIGWVGALIWAISKSAAVTIEGTASEELRQPCPYCAEPIMPAARVCRFCGRELPSGWTDPIGTTRYL